MGLVAEAQEVAAEKERQKKAEYEKQQQAFKKEQDKKTISALNEVREKSSKGWTYLENRFGYTEKDRVDIHPYKPTLRQDEKEKQRLGFVDLLPYLDLGIFIYATSSNNIVAEKRCRCGVTVSNTYMYVVDFKNVPADKEKTFLEDVGSLKGGKCTHCEERDRAWANSD